MADLNDSIVWMVSTRPFISKPSSPYTNPLMTVPGVPITTGITVTFMFYIFFNSLARSRYQSFFSFSFNLNLRSAETAKSTIREFLFLLFLGLVVRPRLNDPFVSLNPREFCVFYSPGQILDCASTICLYDQILMSSTIPSGSLCLPSRVYSYTLSMIVCCISLICDWSFHLYHHITYICNFVASYQFLLWYDWS